MSNRKGPRFIDTYSPNIDVINAENEIYDNTGVIYHDPCLTLPLGDPRRRKAAELLDIQLQHARRRRRLYNDKI